MGAHQLLCLYGGIYLITGTAITPHGGVIMPYIMLDMVYSGMQESVRLEAVQKVITRAHIHIECHGTATDSMIMGIADIDAQNVQS